MIGPDKEVKILRQSRLMKVSEFNKMVNALQRFKEDLVVKALTGKKNIRGQQTPDRIFFSVLEKMLLEVSLSLDANDSSVRSAEQQLLSLRKVYFWFQSNKHVLVKSDGFFKSARKITEEIYDKQMKSRSNRALGSTRNATQAKRNKSSLKTIAVHLNKLYEAERDVDSRTMPSETSMFAPSPTQDLTSIDSATIHDKTYYEEDLDFARESYDHEYMGGNRIERLNRPLTAPPRLKPRMKLLVTKQSSDTMHEMPVINLDSKRHNVVRPQSALTQVKHDLSWAKLSPTPLSVLIQRNAEATAIGDDNGKRKIHVKIPTESSERGSVHVETSLRPPPEEITDPTRIANLVMFKQFLLEHASQQETYMRQYTHHKHGTRQHFLEFPENKTEDVVRKTANNLYTRNEAATSSKPAHTDMDAYRGMSLVDFLDRNSSRSQNATPQDTRRKNDVVESPVSSRTTSAPARLVMMHRNNDSASSDARPAVYSATNTFGPKVPHPPSKRAHTVVQPCHDPVTVSSVYDLASGAGKRMNAAREQALSAPKRGWRYPMVPVAPKDESTSLKQEVSGVVLALQEGDVVQHKVLIPLGSSNGNVETNEQGVQTIVTDLKDDGLMPVIDTASGSARPISSFSIPAGGSSLQSRCSTRPSSSPRYITEVHAVYRQYKPGSYPRIDGKPEMEFTEVEPRHSLRSAGTSGAISRPRTAASWTSYPAHSEVAKTAGAASHHSSGTLRHRSVAETMRVRSVMKRSLRNNSGRSSASSYLSQLRRRKRTGGNLPAQVRPVPRKKIEEEQQVLTDENRMQNPHLSFVSIVAPMHVPANLSASAYARPGGVYCGSTAAVAIATEHPNGQRIDEVISDGELSYEDEEEALDGSKAAEDDDWLSQWLSGGPLDGLHDSAGKGGVTTYADLVSRAAILDSSDERSYSEEAPSSNVAGLDVISPKEDFSLSPRSDPLLSFRTTDTDDVTKDGEVLEEFEKRSDDVIGASSSGDERSLRSDLSSNVTHKEPQEEQDFSFAQENEKVNAQELPASNDEQEQQESEPGSKSASDVDEGMEDLSIGSSSGTREDEDVSIDSGKVDNDAETTSEDELQEANNEAIRDTVILDTACDNEDDENIQVGSEEDAPRSNTVVCEEQHVSEVEHQTDAQKVSLVSDKASSNDAMQGHSSVEKADDGIIASVKKFDNTLNNNTEFEIGVIPESSVTKLDDRLVNEIDDTEKRDSEPSRGALKSEEEEEEDTKCEVVEERRSSTTPESSSDESVDGRSEKSLGSLTASEGEYSNDNCPVRIIITSARKVERELKQNKELAKGHQVVNANGSEAQRHGVNDGVYKSEIEQTDSEMTDTDVNDRVWKAEYAQGSFQAETVHVVKAEDAETDGDVEIAKKTPGSGEHIYAESNTDHMITREEVSAVASLARPVSGRPIPSEVEVRDPFVDLVASTRKRQVDRNVDVQTIFRGTVMGDPYKKFDPEQRRIREEQQEAVVKMQRAYRNHLARTRAIRRSSGIRKDTLEWARSYKAMLVEKSETRKRRLHEARRSTMSSQRRNSERMKRIGPHTEVYEIYHPGPDLPDSELIEDSAVELQRYVRGWIVRLKLERVREMARTRDCSLVDVVSEYRGILERTQRRHGKLRPSLELTYEELADYLQQRAKYELVFQKREFWKEMESSELASFFNDCNHFPSQDEITEAWDAVSKSMDHAQRRKKKHSITAMSLENVVEVAFHIYVPLGTRLEDQRTRSSTWMTPICDGHEGLKLINGDDENCEVEPADMEVVSRLVAQSFKERKESANQ